ncbi:hypothetical protein CAPTEDRAFT_224576 [Capitella teleta]|uniref:Farnesoic acid O-methyl transferase domain-containing protein n=1 Tax=Capitella teleta TaxID=283909 RepID=R7V9A7_CAPTE|nr:hypothetical protein CAPTEDRAFT_224576 [Capitella teleta]|eukprot:ELU15433.1 hypothetical protein CAPTEDRAFT_224576 [Capitella teleta]
MMNEVFVDARSFLRLCIVTKIQAISFLVLMLQSSGEPVHIFTKRVYKYVDDYGVTFDPAHPNISFAIKSGDDAHLMLSNTKQNDESYEVLIGSWRNTRSAIRKCIKTYTCNLKEDHLERVLNATEYLPFWVAWPEVDTGTNITVGKGVVPFEETFLHWTDPDGHRINYIGISSGLFSNGTWVFGHVDGGWSNWGIWSECSTSCGPGVQLRSRTCDDPSPEYGGAECPGSAEDQQQCSVAGCAINGNWGAWGGWSTCSFTCGGGIQQRTRTCSDPAPQYGGQECDGATGEQEARTCNHDECPVHGAWSSWEDWTSCSASCGPGVSIRTRLCDNPTPLNGGESCEGNQEESDACVDIPCPVDGNWSAWSAWSECSASCNHGNRTHFRSCDNPTPAYNGLPCEGEAEAQEECFIEYCPVDGGWSEWSNWTECSETCGLATKVRFRVCDDPSPAYGGNNCSGSDNETVNCEWINCEVNGSWASWNHWSDCSVSCGLGLTTRTRNCSDPPPMYGGLICAGEFSDNTTCNDGPCPIDGSWSPWGYWGECSATCGGGLKTRSRTCTNPQPLHDGTQCVGNDRVNITCNILDCSESMSEDEKEETTEADGAVTIGIIGVVLCASILGAVVVLDIATIHRHLAFMKRNIDDFLYRRGWKKRKVGTRRSRRKSSRRKVKEESPSENCDQEPVDTGQVAIRVDGDGHIGSPMPPNNALTAQLDVNGLRGQGPSRFVGRNNIAENNLNSVDLKNFDSRYHKALNNYSNLEFSQTQL